MLKKLLKYEFKATARYFLPLYGIVIIFALLNRLFYFLMERMDANQAAAFNDHTFVYEGISGYSTPFAILGGTLTSIFVLLLITLFLTAFILTIVRFYRSFVSTEGYLMFTLPVTVHQHLWSKLLVAMVWNIGAVVIFGLSMLLLFAQDVFNIPWLEIRQALQVIFQSGQVGWLIQLGLQGLLMFLLSSISGILYLYFCMAVGQLFNEHKLLASIGAYLLLGTLAQFLAFFAGFAIFPGLLELNWAISPEWAATWIMAAINLVALAVCVLFYFLTHYLLSKRLNLQ